MLGVAKGGTTRRGESPWLATAPIFQEEGVASQILPAVWCRRGETLGGGGGGGRARPYPGLSQRILRPVAPWRPAHPSRTTSYSDRTRPSMILHY